VSWLSLLVAGLGMVAMILSDGSFPVKLSHAGGQEWGRTSGMAATINNETPSAGPDTRKS